MPVTTETQSYSWLKRVSPSLLEKSSTSVIGYPPAFPWAQFTSLLSKQLQLANLQIQPTANLEWREPNALYAGLGDRLYPFNLTIAPMGGTLTWIIPEQDLNILMSLLLTGQKEALPNIDKELEAGFAKFLAIEVISLLPKIEFDKNISVYLMNSTELPKEGALCFDVSVSIAEQAFQSRVIISDELHQQLKTHYSKRTVSSPIANEIDLVVHIEGGSTSMTLSEWRTVSPGDFLLLERGAVQPSGEGSVNLVVDDITVFRGKLNNGSIKIIDAPLYREVGMATDDNHPEEEKEHHEEEPVDSDAFNEEFSNDLDLEDDEENNHASETNGEHPEEEEETEFEELGEALEQEKWPPPPERRPEQPESTEAQETTAVESEHPVTPAPVAVEKEEKIISPEEIPLKIVVEVGRVQMSVQQLMELQPGNMLDLHLHPEDGVDLVVNGRRVAKGELLLVGESLGVRILDIG